MTTYKEEAVDTIMSFKLQEQHLYGSSRLGMATPNKEMLAADTTAEFAFDTLNKRQYELSNHLGNVLSTIYDRKIAVDTNSDKLTDYRLADIASATDYYPFGAPMKGRLCYQQSVASGSDYYYDFSSGTGEFTATGGGVIAATGDPSLLITSSTSGFPVPAYGAQMPVSLNGGLTYHFFMRLDLPCTYVVLRIKNNSGATLDSITESGGSAELIFTAPSSGTYYLEIYQPAGSDCGFYVPYVDISHEAGYTTVCPEGENSYRYGFNGKENDNEVKGDGNQQDYGMRIYDPRLGKFLSVDPLSKDFPWLSSYQYTDNSPIANIDLDGKERYCVIRWYNNGSLQSTTIIAVPRANQIAGRGTLYIELNNTPANVNTYQQLFNVNPNASPPTVPSEATGINWGQIISQRTRSYLIGTYSPSNATQADGLRPYETNIVTNAINAGRPIIASDDPLNPTGNPLSSTVISLAPITVNFTPGSSVLSPAATAQLQPAANVLNAYGSLTANVTGSTDSDDNNTSNVNLGINRGTAVANFIASAGVRAARLAVFSNGETAPTATNATAAGKATNRNAVISINYPAAGN